MIRKVFCKTCISESGDGQHPTITEILYLRCNDIRFLHIHRFNIAFLIEISVKKIDQSFNFRDAQPIDDGLISQI